MRMSSTNSLLDFISLESEKPIQLKLIKWCPELPFPSHICYCCLIYTLPLAGPVCLLSLHPLSMPFVDVENRMLKAGQRTIVIFVPFQCKTAQMKMPISKYKARHGSLCFWKMSLDILQKLEYFSMKKYAGKKI